MSSHVTHGLTGPTSNDEFYASKVNVRAAASLWSTAGYLWRAAEDDVKAGTAPPAQPTAAAPNVALDAQMPVQLPRSTKAYVDGVSTAMRAFMRRKTLWGRATTKDALLEHCQAQEGRMVLLLGGKDVGKSLLLTAVASELNTGATHVAVVVDMRDGLPLATAIVKAVYDWASSVATRYGSAFKHVFEAELMASVKHVLSEEVVDANPSVFEVLDAEEEVPEPFDLEDIRLRYERLVRTVQVLDAGHGLPA